MLALRLCAIVSIAVVTLLVGGGSLEAADETAMVMGKVSLNGRPLAEGKIVLHAEGVKAVEIPVKDGVYSAEGVAVGRKTVTIEGAGVPLKFSARETTPLTVEVKGGKNELVFELKS